MEDFSKISKEKESNQKQFFSNNKKLKKKGIFKIIKFGNFSFTKYKNKITNDNKDNNQNNKIKKTRNPGVDLVRMIAMYNIVLNHSMFHGGGFGYYPQYKRQLSFLHSFTDYHNDAFMLISGIIGYKTCKYSNLLYLWLTVFFYSVGIHNYILRFKKGFYINQPMYKEYFPIIFQRYGYFTSYFGMYLFLPVINKGIEYVTKFELKLVISSTIGILIFWKEYKNHEEDVFFMKGGGSVLWYITLYLTGAFIGKYRTIYSGIKKYIYCFICLFIFTFFSYLIFIISQNELPLRIYNYKLDFPINIRKMINFDHNAPVKVIQSITISLFCLQIHYNKYIAKIICFTGPLIFGIYLVHEHNLIRQNIITHFFSGQPRNLSWNSVLPFLLLKDFKIFIFGLVIDYLRNLLFTILRLKKIFIFIETKMKEKLS